MEKQIRVFEPAMCCSSGLCGPAPDQSVIDFNALIEKVEAQGYTVERFMITRDAAAFQAEPRVIDLLNKEQLDALPITMIGKKIIREGAYPTYEEIVAASA